MDRTIALSTIFAFAIGGASAWAGEASIPHTFEPNTPAKAGEVNENFDTLKGAVNDNNSRLQTMEESVNSNTSRLDQMDTDSQQGPCASIDDNDVMVRVGNLCVDKYEASVWDAEGGSTADATRLSDNGSDDSPGNDYGCSITGSDCDGIYARSEPDVQPSTQISWFQAQRACANSGKRLLTNAEWQMAVAGTPDEPDDASTTCNTNGTGLVGAGTRDSCTSDFEVNDMVGNAWEWVGDWMQGIQSEGQDTQPGGFGGDAAMGIYAGTSDDGTSSVFPGALLRGGSFADGAGAGEFAMLADWQPSAAQLSIGFRCAR